MASNKDSVKHTLIVAITLCLVCSILVSAAAVMLRPIQETNKSLDKKRNILITAGLYEEGTSVEEAYKSIDVKMIDVATGSYISDADVTSFDQRKAASDPKTSRVLSSAEDLASIKRLENRSLVYLVKDAKGEVEKIILPIRGYGLWSTMRGFIALASDAETIEGFNLYDHAETPGLGGEVANPEWRKTWEGKKVINDSGEPAIQLVKGGVNASSPQAKYQVDSLSGATLTSKGVENLMHFWMGDNGFGPFLAKFKKGAA